ncbi:MAG: NAD(+) kinase [Gammaproteobacteria bacterium]|nr:NAD(+) kinase [Gammaproteobacteria bacterium]MDH5592949.1 NAD(+) kinase [Gammaproteobacteria bacterium]
MSKQFSKIGLIGKFGDPGVEETLDILSNYLEKKGLSVVLDEHTAGMLKDNHLPTGSRDDIGKNCDLAIVIGGDGTLLNAARSLAKFEVALLGINLGRLGFLVDISPDNMINTLDAILKGDYQEEHRTLLNCEIICEGGMKTTEVAFNDVVVHKWNVARMIEVEVYIDGLYVNTQRSDGLIISTPTGSTAYALSGGGPILHPSLDSMVIVPICPHTMSYRPLVVGGCSKIEVVISHNNQDDAQVTCDGQLNQNLVNGDRIIISCMEKRIHLIHPKSHDYYEILRAKLKWAEKL